MWIPNEIIAGTAAGVFGTTIGHPLDTIKVKLQTQREYKGVIDCFVKIVKHEGVRGLYKGLLPPLLNMAFLNSISFGLFSALKIRVLSEFPNHKNLAYVLAGSLTGASAGFFSTPFEMVKIQTQLLSHSNISTDKKEIKPSRVSGSIATASYLIRNHGPLIFYRGYLVNLSREVLFCGTYFGLYETLKQTLYSKFHTNSIASNALIVMVSGGFSGASSWFISFPLDVVKSCIQGQPISLPRKSAWDYTKERYHSHGGIRAFYSGVGASLLRAFIVSSSRFLAFETTLNFLKSTKI